MKLSEMAQKLADAGYDSGWALADEVLVIWEHPEDPPAPLTRPEPTEAADDPA